MTSAQGGTAPLAAAVGPLQGKGSGAMGLGGGAQVIPTPSLPLTDVSDPLDTDVLCGRGGAALRHPGNQTYRRLVTLNKGLYTTCLKAEKLKISRSIVAAIRETNGRFLERDSKKGTWFDIGDKKAMEKTSQALREGQPKLRKKIHELGGVDNGARHLAMGGNLVGSVVAGHPGLDGMTAANASSSSADPRYQAVNSGVNNSVNSGFGGRNASMGSTTTAVAANLTEGGPYAQSFQGDGNLEQRSGLLEMSEESLQRLKLEAEGGEMSSVGDGRPGLGDKLPSLRTRALRPELQRSVFFQKLDLVPNGGVANAETGASNQSLMSDFSDYGMEAPKRSPDAGNVGVGEDGQVVNNGTHNVVDNSPVSLWDASDQDRPLTAVAEGSEMENAAGVNHPVMSYMADLKPADGALVEDPGDCRRQVFAKLKGTHEPSSSAVSSGGGTLTSSGKESLFAMSSVGTLGNTVSSRSMANAINTGEIWRSKELSSDVEDDDEKQRRRASDVKNPKSISSEDAFDREMKKLDSKASLGTIETKDFSMAGASKRSLLSGFSKVSGVSDMSLLSDLSKKIGDVSTRSIDMSVFSGMGEEQIGTEPVINEHGWKLDTIEGSKTVLDIATEESAIKM